MDARLTLIQSLMVQVRLLQEQLSTLLQQQPTPQPQNTNNTTVATPSLVSLSPASGVVGARIYIQGQNVQAGDLVNMRQGNGTRADASVQGNTVGGFYFTVPSQGNVGGCRTCAPTPVVQLSSGLYAVSVEKAGYIGSGPTSNSLQFQLLQSALPSNRPYLTSLSRTSGPVGTRITFTGANIRVNDRIQILTNGSGFMEGDNKILAVDPGFGFIFPSVLQHECAGVFPDRSACNVPVTSGSYGIQVIGSGGSGTVNTLYFEVTTTPPSIVVSPTITYLSPDNGDESIGYVTIYGSGSSLANVDRVEFYKDGVLKGHVAVAEKKLSGADGSVMITIRPGTLIANSGTGVYQVKAVNSQAKGGASSNALAFTITDSQPVITTPSISYVQCKAGERSVLYSGETCYVYSGSSSVSMYGNVSAYLGDASGYLPLAIVSRVDNYLEVRVPSASEMAPATYTLYINKDNVGSNRLSVSVIGNRTQIDTYDFNVSLYDVTNGGIVEIEKGQTIQRQLRVTLTGNRSQIVKPTDSVNTATNPPTFSWNRREFSTTVGGDIGVLTIGALGVAPGDYQVTHTFDGRTSGSKRISYTLRVKSPTITQTPTIIIYPSGGESLTMGTNVNIRWQNPSQDYLGEFSLHNANDLSQKWRISQTGNFAVGPASISWRVGHLFDGNDVAAGQYKISICRRAADGSSANVTGCTYSGAFTITSASVSVAQSNNMASVLSAIEAVLKSLMQQASR